MHGPADRSLLSRRNFLAAMAAAGIGYGAYRAGRFYLPTSSARGKVVIVGGGTAGLAIASRLHRALSNPDITLIDAASTHYYQPGFTLVAAGVFQPDEVVRQEADFVPAGVRWIRDQAVEADPDHNSIRTASHGDVHYDFLVLCPGLKMDFDAIQGLNRDSLGQGNAHCIYDFRSAQQCWTAIQELGRKGGRAVFTDTWTKLKCGGAPKKINLVAEHYCRLQGTRERVDFRYFSGIDHLFDVPLYRQRVDQIFRERNIPVAFNHRIQSIDTAARKITFVRIPGTTPPETVTVEYDFLHFVPPMSAPDFVKQSPLVVNSKGVREDWVPADKSTLVHWKYSNVVVAGDVAGLPTSKTGAAIRSQAPVATANLIALMEGKAPTALYDGYTACPVITEYGKVLLAEFGYDKMPRPTLPFLDPGREHAAGWWLKTRVLKPMYFDGILKGRA